MERQITLIKRIVLALILSIVGYFSFVAITQPASEGDSLAYHIPIAQSILSGAVFHPENTGYGLMFYPGASEAVLSIFMLLHIPLNSFNVLSWILLGILLYALSSRITKSKTVPYLLVLSILFLPSVIRLIPTQTIDIWVAVFFTWVLYILLEKSWSASTFLKLGIAMGMLIGTKVSGILFSLVFLAVFLPTIRIHSSTKRIIVFLFPLTLLGLSWYLRNFITMGNPLYPAHLPFFVGKSNFQIQNSTTLKTLISHPSGIVLFIQSLVSEYLVWILSLIFTPIIIAFSYLKKKKWVSRNIFILSLIGFLNFAIYLILPSSPVNMVSDLRYAYPAFIPLILASLLILDKLKLLNYIAPVILVSAVFVFTQLDYLPKLFFAIILIELLFCFAFHRKKIHLT